ncbi:JAB domain-containing protein [Paracraurococcus lichenis]|uniref:JAB domain-containing protein n=1 Tax=Paracraurococcus lichenis TaxID=3064888 RepID=A0ABT9DVZ3_9PROT|nr:JAB domain-containing protein [Paracraurococcus sp. LOR1-02]MDO9708062.1 JAB domain-containing protein [Paracraurococcus sp. LOR1-02]
MQPDFIEQIGDRDALFGLLSQVMPWAQASAAVAALLSHYGSLTEALAAPEAELAAIAELGPSAAGVLKVTHAAALRLVSAPLKQGPVLGRWRDLEAYLMAAMAREPLEQARALFLDTRNRLIADEVIARGGPRGVNPDHRALAHRAVQLHATALILAHNHPSGDPMPSPEDIDYTRQLRDVLATLGVVLHDHVVVARGGIVSLRQLGVIGR